MKFNTWSINNIENVGIQKILSAAINPIRENLKDMTFPKQTMIFKSYILIDKPPPTMYNKAGHAVN